MSSPSSTDPFSLVIDLIWDLLESKSSFTDEVAEANRIKLWTKRAPFKDSVTEESVPEVIVVPTSQSTWLHRNSGGAGFNKTFAVLVSSGDQRIETLFPVDWAIVKALYDFETTGLALEYETEKFVKDINILETQHSLTDDELNRSLRGWSTVWNAQVLMYFSNTILRGE